MFQVYRDNANDFRWRLLAKNGLTIADSAEGYRRRDACKKAIEKVKAIAPDAEINERLG